MSRLYEHEVLEDTPVQKKNIQHTLNTISFAIGESISKSA